MADFTEHRHLPNAISAPVTCKVPFRCLRRGRRPYFPCPPTICDFTEHRHLQNALWVPPAETRPRGDRLSLTAASEHGVCMCYYLCCYLTVQIHVPESTFTSGHLPASHERRPKRQKVACSFFSFTTSGRPVYPPSSAVPASPRRHQVDLRRKRGPIQIHGPESTFTSGHLPASHERRPKRQQVACSFFSFRTSSRPLYPPSSAVPPCPRRHQVDCPRLISGVLNVNRSPVLSSP